MADFSNLQYDYQNPAIIAVQDISGQQPSFYQEPSVISHQLVQPQYSNQKNKHKSAEKNQQPLLQPINVRSNLPQAEEQILVQNPDSEQYTPIRIENIPILLTPETTADIPTGATPEIETEPPMNVNFRKIDYNFDLNTWYHIAFTWSAEDRVLRIYVNARLVGILQGTMPLIPALPSNGLMLLGKTLLPSLTDFDPTSHLTGAMSDFTVWNSRLGEDEIRDLFTCTSNVQTDEREVLLSSEASTNLRVYNDASLSRQQPLCAA